MKKIGVSKGQNIFDVALSHYGDAAEGIMQLWRDNPDLPLLSGDLAAGLELKINKERVINQEAVENYSRAGQVNTGSYFTPIDSEEEGIFDYTFDYTFE